MAITKQTRFFAVAFHEEEQEQVEVEEVQNIVNDGGETETAVAGMMMATNSSTNTATAAEEGEEEDNDDSSSTTMTINSTTSNTTATSFVCNGICGGGDDDGSNNVFSALLLNPDYIVLEYQWNYRISTCSGMSCETNITCNQLDNKLKSYQMINDEMECIKHRTKMISEQVGCICNNRGRS